jgi:hypothetical protein
MSNRVTVKLKQQSIELSCEIERSYLFGLLKRVRIKSPDSGWVGVKYLVVPYWKVK